MKLVGKRNQINNTSPFQEQLAEVTSWWADSEVLGQVVTESGARVGEVWYGGGLQ